MWSILKNKEQLRVNAILRYQFVNENGKDEPIDYRVVGIHENHVAVEKYAIGELIIPKIGYIVHYEEIINTGRLIAYLGDSELHDIYNSNKR